MRRFITLLCALIFVSLFLSCSHEFSPQQGTITFDAGSSVEKVSKKAREAFFDNFEELDELDEYIEDDAVQFQLAFKLNVSGDFEETVTDYIDITKFMTSEEDEQTEIALKSSIENKTFTITEIPVGSKVTVSAEIGIKTTINIPLVGELLKELIDSLYEESKMTGTSEEIVVKAGDNPAKIKLEFTGEKSEDEEDDEDEEEADLNLIISALVEELKDTSPLAQTTGTASGYEGNFTFKLYPDDLYTIEYTPVGIVSMGSCVKVNNTLMIFEIFYYDTSAKKLKNNKIFADHFLSDKSEYQKQNDEALASWLTEEIFKDSVIAVMDSTKSFSLKGKSGIEITFNYLFKTYPASGEIEINNPKLTIGINDDASTVKIEQNKITAYLNYNTIKFSLNDENNTDIITENLTASAAANWEYKLTYQGTELTYPSFYTYEPGKITLGNLPREGTYQLYVQAKPKVSGYEACALASGSFEFEFVNYTYYSFSVDQNAGDDYIDFNKDSPVENLARTTLKETTSDVYLHLYGESSSELATLFGSDFHDFIFYYFKDKSNKFMIDASEVTAQDTIFSSYAFRDLNMIKSIILPDTATSYLMAIFQQNTSLEYVKFGAATKSLGEMSISDNSSSLFQGCTNLKKVEFANTEGWYSAPESVRTDLIDWSSLTVPKYDNLNQPVTENGNPVYIILTAVDVSDPEANANHIKNDHWVNLYRKTE